MSQVILDAINKMDPENDNHWTVDGLARLETVKFLAGQTVSRDELEAAAPGFNREALRAYRQGGAIAPPVVNMGTGSGSIAGGVAPPAQSPPPAAVEPTKGPEDRKTQVEALAAQIASEDETILELKRVQAQAGKDIVAAVKRKDALQEEINKLNPPESTMSVIQAYLASQIKLGEERAERIRMIKDSGVDLKELARITSPSGLDVAMRNRHRRHA